MSGVYISEELIHFPVEMLLGRLSFKSQMMRTDKDGCVVYLQIGMWLEYDIQWINSRMLMKLFGPGKSLLSGKHLSDMGLPIQKLENFNYYTLNINRLDNRHRTYQHISINNAVSIKFKSTKFFPSKKKKKNSSNKMHEM